MKAVQKRMAAVSAAAAIALGTIAAMPASAIEKDLVLFSSEAEKCTITDGGTATDKVYNDEYPGFTGDGFVWAGNAGGFSFDVDLKEGAMYEVTVRSYSYLGDRLQNLAIDGEVVATVNFQQSSKWEDISFGSFYIPEGKHTIEVGASGSWGFMLYDSVQFGYAKMPKMEIKPTPCDKKATAETKALMQYLTSVYGKQVLAGQQEIYGSGHDGNYEYEFDYLSDTTGKLPAVRGFDMMNYNPLYGWDDNSTERIIDWTTNKNGIATACWHLNVPIDFENYTLGDEVDWKDCTYKNYQASNGTFNTEKILDKTSKERQYFDAAVKLLAEQFLRVQEAGAPIIFRPLHEAQGNYGRYGDGTAWFWWGDRGPEVYKELWKLLYTELTETYGVHNLIWEQNLYEMDNSIEWYPGAEYVDIIAYDKYEGSPTRWETDPATSVFLKLVGYSDDTKMVALAECDKIPEITKIRNEGAWWLYVCPWYDDYITSESNNTKALLKEFYNSDLVLTLDEMPKDLYSADPVDGTDSKTTTTTTVTTTTATETTSSEGSSNLMRGDVNLDKIVDVKDAVMLARMVGGDITVSVKADGEKNADMNNDGKHTPEDLTILMRTLAHLI
ncbi:MAG TPA: glycoside hydrolase [Ruminococcus sp.]|nr:glycoside hydrolase [Ruminococcus sp.]